MQKKPIEIVSDEYKHAISNLSEVSGLSTDHADKCVRHLNLDIKLKTLKKKLTENNKILKSF